MKISELSIEGETTYGVGDTGTFKLLGVEGDYTLTWSSSDESIGKIDASTGDFVGISISADSIKITATVVGYINRNEETRTCSIDVKVNKYYLLKNGELKNSVSVDTNANTVCKRFYSTDSIYWYTSTTAGSIIWRPHFAFTTSGSYNYYYAKANNTEESKLGQFMRFGTGTDANNPIDFSDYSTINANIKFILPKYHTTSNKLISNSTGYVMVDSDMYPGSNSSDKHIKKNSVDICDIYENKKDEFDNPTRVSLPISIKNGYIIIGYTTQLTPAMGNTEVYIMDIWLEK